MQNYTEAWTLNRKVPLHPVVPTEFFSRASQDLLQKGSVYNTVQSPL